MTKGETVEGQTDGKNLAHDAPWVIFVEAVLVIGWILLCGYFIGISSAFNFTPYDSAAFINFLSLGAQVTGTVAGFLIAVFAYIANGRKTTREIFRAGNFDEFIRGLLSNYIDVILVGLASLIFLIQCYSCTLNYAQFISTDPSSISDELMRKQVNEVLTNFRFGVVLLTTSIFLSIWRKWKIIKDGREKIHTREESGPQI